MTVKLRAGTQADAVQCGTICYEAFKAINTQHNFPPDFPSAEVGERAPIDDACPPTILFDSRRTRRSRRRQQLSRRAFQYLRCRTDYR